MSDVQVVDVHKAFGETKALDGCTLHAYPGEIHAIIGENGSGKSTLAKVLSGIHTIDSGTVSIDGQRPTSPQEARRLGVATIFQEILVADETSITDNLFVGVDGLWLRKVPEDRKHSITAEMMHRFTGEHIDPSTPVGELPLSVKQWIVIGRALIGDPKVLIFDESSAALDLDGTARLHDEMRKLRDKGACVIIVTHRIAELVRITDRATVLRDGRTVGELSKSDITEANLLALMTGQAKSAGSTASPAQARAAIQTKREPVLRADHMSFGGKRSFDLSLLEGEVMGITGLDGAGQDDFVRALAGICPNDVGNVKMKVGSIWSELHDPLDAENAGMAFVSGDRKREGIFPNLSIFENLSIGLYKQTSNKAGFIARSKLEQIFAHEVRRFSIKIGNQHNRITTLSGGNQQKVLISRALAAQPRVIVLNDPARGVDIGTKKDLYRELKNFVAAGGAVVYLSSELEEFFDFADRVAVFHDQSIFHVLEGSDICEEKILPAMFGHTGPVHFDEPVVEVS